MGRTVPLVVVEFCAVECMFQQSGERSVSWMCDAWYWATMEMDAITPEIVGHLGRVVEPIKNFNGFRQTGVRVGQSVKPDWRQVPRMMENLCSPEALQTLDPAEWFRQFEEVHPFVDGNGRTGQILYNWRKGSMGHPTWAPDFWGDPRRREGFGS